MTDAVQQDAGDGTRALSDVLDRLEDAIEGDEMSVQEVVDGLGHASFSSVLLVFSLIGASPASGIPGLTALIGIISLTLIVQMMVGRNSLWLPGFITRRCLDTDKLKSGISWLRKPVGKVEQVLRPRLSFLFHRPWRWLPMVLVACLAMFMPVMELVPMSGSIASVVIACFAGGLLTRDGALLVVAALFLSAVPVVVYAL